MLLSYLIVSGMHIQISNLIVVALYGYKSKINVLRLVILNVSPYICHVSLYNKIIYQFLS